MRVLLVEDEPALGAAVEEHIRDSGHAVDRLMRLDDAEAALRAVDYGLVLLDLNLPDGSGIDLLKSMRRQGDTRPVIILTARDQIRDRIAGLNAGADDYLVKPFEPRELVARVRSILRRYQKAPVSEATGHTGARFAGWHFDIGRLNLCTEDGREVSLSAAEAALLQTLLKRPNKILTREQLIGERDLDPFDRSIDVRISRLRRKLEDDPQDPKIIKTVYGAGYLLCASVDWE